MIYGSCCSPQLVTSYTWIRNQTVSKSNEPATRDMKIDSVSASTASKAQTVQDTMSTKLRNNEYRCRLERLEELVNWATKPKSFWWASTWQQFRSISFSADLRFSLRTEKASIDGAEASSKYQIALKITISSLGHRCWDPVVLPVKKQPSIGANWSHIVHKHGSWTFYIQVKRVR